MKINKRLTVWFGAFFVFLIMTIGNGAADPAQGTETRITTNESAQSNPDIYKNLIVWQDERNGDENADIYMYDLSTSKETRITKSGSAMDPAIYGNRIVWMDGRNGGSLDADSWPVGNWDIYMYDLSTSTEYQITTNELMQKDPDIYGDRVVWTDERNGNSDIYMQNLSTSKQIRITTNASEQYHPKIYSNTIMWEDLRNGNDENFNYDIYMYDLSTSTETGIVTNEFYREHTGNIYGKKIVYTTEPAGDLVWMHDLSTSQDTLIASDAWGPDIYGDRIVYHGGGTGMPMRMYNISTSTETEITTDDTGTSPAIYGNRIVWADDRNENYDIYMFTLSSSLPVAAFSASPSSGKAPLKVTFTDKSTASPTKWRWNFGDGAKSSVKNPKHTYSKTGNYTVSLTATNSAGSNTTTKTNYIKVTTNTRPGIYSKSK